MTSRWLCIVVLVGVTLPGGRAEIVLGKEDDEFDFDGLPGAQHEFKVEVGAGTEECYYQMIKEGGQLHVSFEVLEGGELTVALKNAFTMPHLTIETVSHKTDGMISYDVPSLGTYAICLDNTHSMMYSKLVYVYYVTYVPEEWKKYHQEISDLHITVGNFSTSIRQVDDSIKATLLHQADTRMHVGRDYYMSVNINRYVQNWSIVQCVVIIACAAFQVYFVRRLFRTDNVAPKSHKPRA